ncbi:hypothetical protein BGZ99_008948 [Dissophora globulifera]|uniref:Frizzled/Smoothened 7TM domain-containing protein n=1 Tax=Dissophora globulifera TaxID=979702 RepID=A0A9P6R685_9FUNG|nr:hypothetical protein BGZ99_008948 [Dissophora globulifera]
MAQTAHRATPQIWRLSATLLAVLLSYILAVSSATTDSASTRTVVPTNTVTNSIVPTPTIDFNLVPSAPAQPTPSTGNNNVAAGNSTLSASCPPPLISNIFNLTSGSCVGPCCIPCPASSAFYEPDRLANSYTFNSAVRVVSAVCTAFLTICYLILPKRRKHPHLIILLFAIVMTPWQGLGTAWLFKREELLCKSPYEIATMNNSWLCGLQGACLMYMTLVLIFISVTIIVNLHALTVYRSTLIQDHMTKFIIVAFVLPLSLVVPVVVKKQIENPGFGSICFTSSTAAAPYFLYPLCGIVILEVSLHMATIGFMLRASLRNRSNSNVSDSTSSDFEGSQHSNMTKTQRPKKLLNITPTTTWFINWIQCLGEQAVVLMQSGRLSATSTPDQLKEAGDFAQKVCAAVAEPFVPSFTWSILSDFMPGSLGIGLLIIFGSKTELWQDIRLRMGGYKEETALITGGITKDSQDIRKQHMDDEEQGHQRQQQQWQKHHRPGKQDNRLQSNEFQVDDNTYSSQDRLTLPQPTAWSESNAKYRHHPKAPLQFTMPSSPASPSSFNNSAVYGGPHRKRSITIRDSREPIYYQSPSQ